MAAFQETFPDLTLMLTFGPSLVWGQSQGGKVPLEACRYGLLVPFVDGMIEAAKGKMRIVDGFEQSYSYREAAAFEKAHELMTSKAAGLMADPPAYRRLISAGFGLWLDCGKSAPRMGSMTLSPATADQHRSMRVRSSAETCVSSRDRKRRPRSRSMARWRIKESKAPCGVEGMLSPSGPRIVRRSVSPSSTWPLMSNWVEACRFSSRVSAAVAPTAACR